MDNSTSTNTKTFPFGGVNWKVVLTQSRHDPTTQKIFRTYGPYCKDSACFGMLALSEPEKTANCPLCGAKYDFDEDTATSLKTKAFTAIQAELDKKLPFIPIDSLRQPLTSEDSDEENWVRARLGYTSDGRKVVSVLVGEKQNSKKTHAFLDLDKEQLRFDWKNIKPNEIVASLEANFINAKHTITTKSQKKSQDT